ncbi:MULTISPECIES: hypothetical protein [Chryseobacterium]|uniref:hypothetical protein n=1 Tax=Chryseobacterium TaxID=59732 RepID=UPI000F99B005|nr:MULTISPECIES: hypothetical protein [Chryseobacterium]MBM7417548.1 hypothetical protein [Chryseobacterium sp. JUb44]MDH6211740.1 hypothetical protein [Chryseobacterium sp. BIGb0186]WSO10381.1 hypothetical protein VUJ64_00355 [Chryseobacterium scophthalmum]
MKPHLFIFGFLIAGFAAYNLFFALPDDRMDTLVNIVYASVLFGYISFMAFTVLRKLKK